MEAGQARIVQGDSSTILAKDGGENIKLTAFSSLRVSWFKYNEQRVQYGETPLARSYWGQVGVAR